MHAKLHCHFGKLAGKEFPISKEATIGKLTTNTIVLDHITVSGQHARIFYDDNERSYFIEDFGSRNGTKLDGIRVTQREKLGKLNAITFANECHFFFQLMPDQVDEIPEPEVREASKDSQVTEIDKDFVPPPEIDEQVDRNEQKAATKLENTFVDFPQLPHELEPLKQEMDRPKVSESSFVLELQDLQRSYALKNGKNIVGRAKYCEIFIDDKSVSREHASINVKAGKVFLKDLDSLNDTFVNGKKLLSETEVEPDTKIVFGDIEAILIRKIT